MPRQTAPTREPRLRSGGLVRSGLTGRQNVRIDLDPRPAYDFLISASRDCGDATELLPEDRRWQESAQAALLKNLGPGGAARECLGFVSELAPLLLTRPEITSARQLVAAIDSLSDDEIFEVLIGELTEDAELGPVARRAAGGDVAAFRELSAMLADMKGHAILPVDRDALVPAMRRIVHAWLPEYETIEGRVTRMLERDVSNRKLDDAAGDPLGFVERATNGIRLVPEPGVRRMVLAPSYFTRPYNQLTRREDTRLICYPIADESLGAADRLAPAPATLRLYRALGDESRLRILRLLSERDWYLTELANELELSKPTIKHHLAQLRSAGLVTLTEEGNLTYYSLRLDRIQEAGTELSAYLSR